MSGTDRDIVTCLLPVESFCAETGRSAVAVLSFLLPRGVMEYHREEHILCRVRSLGHL